jgi:uncharacterized protein
MSTRTSTLEMIQGFLAQKRIAMIGISRDPTSFSAKLFEEFCKRGYDMVPVNPGATEILGRPCYAHLQDIHPAVEAVLLMTSPEVTETVVKDCAEAGVHWVWMHRATGQGAVSARAVAFCQSRGIQVIPGECPLMFFPDAEVIHRLHGFIRRVTRSYPRVARA